MGTADKLRQLADLVEDRDVLEDEYEEAKAAYESDTEDEDLKAKYHEAAAALREIRGAIRGSGLMIGSSEPGSVTVGAPMLGRPRAVPAEEEA